MRSSRAGPAPAGSQRPAVSVLGGSLALAGLIGWCALPAAIGDIIMLPHAAALSHAQAGLPVEPGALAAAADAGLRAADWSDRDGHLTEAAIAALAARRTAAAGAALGAALALRPTASRNWLRLASARLATDPAGARAAWTMAVATAPFDPPMIRPTLAIGFALLPTRDAGFAARLALRVRIAARLDPVGLARAARMRGAVPFVYASLFRDPDLDWRFAIALASVSQPTAGGMAP